jgi:RND family efflux transporter MFP subunit
MKHIIKLFALLLLAACADKQKSVEQLIEDRNLVELRATRAQLTEEKIVIEKQIELLDDAISNMGERGALALVSIFEVTNQPFEHYIELQGSVQTKQNLLIYPEMPGTLKKVFVKEGQAVRKGQLIARVDDGGMSSQLTQLEAQLALAKTTFERQERLWNQKIGSEIQFLQAKTSYEASVQAKASLEQQLKKSKVYAPFAGRIDKVFFEEGAVVAPGAGSALFRVVNLTEMYLEVDVPEAYVATVVNGTKTKVFIPVLNRTVETSIHHTGSFINPGNRSFKAQVKLSNENEDIKPNLTAKVQIRDYFNENAMLIPQSLLTENAEGNQFVYVIENKNNKTTVQRRIVETGESQGDLMEVTSGIAVGDRLVAEGARRVRDNQEVEIVSSLD